MTKDWIIKYKKAINTMLHIYNHLNFKNHFKIRNSDFKYGCSKINKTILNVHGNNNIVEIEDNCSLKQTQLYIEDNCNVIRIGKDTSIHGKKI